MKVLAKRLIANCPDAAAEVAQYCRLKVDTIANPGGITHLRWGADPRHPADKLLLLTNHLGVTALTELAEYIEGQLPPAVAMRAAA